MKRRLNTLKGKKLVTGDPNLMTKDEICINATPNGVEVKEIGTDGKIKDLAGSGDNGSSNKNVKYYGIGSYFRGLHVSTSESLKIGQLGSIIPISIDYRQPDAMSNNGMGYYFYYNKSGIDTVNPFKDAIIKCTPSSVISFTNSDGDYKVLIRIDYDGVIDFITKFKEFCDENGMYDDNLEQLVSLKEELVELTEEEYFKYLEDIGVYNSIFN